MRQEQHPKAFAADATSWVVRPDGPLHWPRLCSRGALHQRTPPKASKKHISGNWRILADLL